MFITYLAVLCGFQAPPGRLSRKFPVVHSERETPLPIPNRAVKPFSADGTWGETSWESRSPPVLLSSGPRQELAGAAVPRYRDNSWRGPRKPASWSRLHVAPRRIAVRLVARGGAGEASAQPWRGLPAGSKPYSPRVAKSISRSTASVSRLWGFVVE